MTTLNDINQQFELLCELVDKQEGVLPNDLLERFAETSLEHTKKIDAYLAVLDRCRIDSAYYSERSETLLRRAKTCEKVEKAIKERLKDMIIAHPDLPWKSSDGDKLRVQDSPEALVIEQETDFLISMVPTKYVKIISKLDREKVKEDLKNGVILEWARLERGTHLRIY